MENIMLTITIENITLTMGRKDACYFTVETLVQ